MAVNEKRFVAAEKFSGRAKRGMRLFMAHGSAKLGQVALDFAMQGLWLGHKKVKSHVVSEDQSPLLGRRAVGEVKRGRRGSTASDRTMERIHRFRRVKHVACNASASALTMINEACQKAEM